MQQGGEIYRHGVEGQHRPAHLEANNPAAQSQRGNAPGVKLCLCCVGLAGYLLCDVEHGVGWDSCVQLCGKDAVTNDDVCRLQSSESLQSKLRDGSRAGANKSYGPSASVFRALATCSLGRDCFFGHEVNGREQPACPAQCLSSQTHDEEQSGSGRRKRPCSKCRKQRSLGF